MPRGAALFGAWMLLAAFDQPEAGLDYDLSAAAADEQLSAPSTSPPEPGEQYPARLEQQASRPEAPLGSAAADPSGAPPSTSALSPTAM